jgi:hypothetical protein
MPTILARAGTAAVFAAEEFFFGRIRNEHTGRRTLPQPQWHEGDGRIGAEGLEEPDLTLSPWHERD